MLEFPAKGWFHAGWMDFELVGQIRNVETIAVGQAIRVLRYRGLSEEEKEKGLYGFAAKPPQDDDFLITRLWNRFLKPTWRDPVKTPLNEERQKALIKQLEEMSKAAPVSSGTVDPDSLDYIVIERKVQKRRGSYWQVPKDLKDAEQ